MTASSVPSCLDPFLAHDPLAPGEDRPAYEALRESLLHTLEPRDALEWIWIQDYIHLTWELQRHTRVRADILARGRRAVLWDQLGRHLKANAPAARLVRRLLERWEARDPDAVADVERRLAEKGFDVSLLATRAYAANLERLEILDKMSTRLTQRRERLLREINRRRAAQAQRLRAVSDTGAPKPPDASLRPEPPPPAHEPETEYLKRPPRPCDAPAGHERRPACPPSHPDADAHHRMPIVVRAEAEDCLKRPPRGGTTNGPARLPAPEAV
jgi:hypothetical protein